MAKLQINGTTADVAVEDGTPLSWVLREQLGLTGTKYGCGVGQCGACMILNLCRSGAYVYSNCGQSETQRRHRHDRRLIRRRQPPPAAGLRRTGHAAMRLLYPPG